MPPQRLIDLVQAGDIQSARMLARGILKNDDVLNVKFSEIITLLLKQKISSVNIRQKL